MLVLCIRTHGTYSIIFSQRLKKRQSPPEEDCQTEFIGKMLARLRFAALAHDLAQLVQVGVVVVET